MARLHAAHRGGLALRLDVDARSLGGMPQLSGSASIAGTSVAVTLVNASARDAEEVDVRIDGATSIRRAEVEELVAPGLLAPSFVRVGPRAVTSRAATLRVEVPALSVARIALELA